MGNDNLHRALKNKNDEFYTYYEDIEKEIPLYKQYLVGKKILLPADNENSNFWKYFNDNYSSLQLKGIIATHLEEEKSYCLIREENYIQEYSLNGNGDFFSKEIQDVISTIDVVITNPPFSRFRDFVISVLEKNKDFIFIGTENAATAKETFPLFRDEKIFFGKNKVKTFLKEDGTNQSFGNITWLTSFRNSFNNPLSLSQTYKRKFL